MPRLVDAVNLKGNPFEHYVAELEPNIDDYAVKPPYFEAIEARANGLSSFILFGDRGAGKSATRLTIFKEIWRRKEKGESAPLAVNLLNFSSVISGKSIKDLSESALISEVAFVVVEAVLAWLSSLSEGDRSVYLGAMNKEETDLCYSLVRDFYASKPDSQRERSAYEALELLNQALGSKGALWVSRKWNQIADLIGTIAEAIVKTKVSEANVGKDVSSVLRKGEAGHPESVLVLRKLVRFAEIFNFSGVVVMIDKVDETDATQNSVERAAELIHPLLSRVQLSEVRGFAWIFFLWSSIKKVFEENQDRSVRLDKIGHGTVSWDDEFFLVMLEKRVSFFSDNKIDLSGLFSNEVDTGKVVADLVKVSMRSPREIIRMMDIIVREHDVLNASASDIILLNQESVERGLDVYVKDRISSIFGERLLAQIFRLNQRVFTNKDVQRTFRVGSQSARTRIQSWENAGIIKLTGTRAAEGVQGGKPANEYSIVDARVERVMDRQLITYADPIAPEDGFEEEITD